MALLTTEKTNLPASDGMQLPTLEQFFFGEELFPFNALRRSMFAPFMTNWPAVNLYRKSGAYVVEVAVPGYVKENLTIDVAAHTLAISGKLPVEPNGKTYDTRELRMGSFVRTITLPFEINPELVTANFANGLLTITLQPPASVQGTAIPIKG